jgi:hypothetical protein
MSCEITLFEKSGGILSKHISLKSDGSIHSDGSACVMSRGRASRTKVADVHALAALIASLRPYQAIALGVIRDGLPDQVKIVTKQKTERRRAAERRHRPIGRLHRLPAAPAGVRADRLR